MNFFKHRQIRQRNSRIFILLYLLVLLFTIIATTFLGSLVMFLMGYPDAYLTICCLLVGLMFWFWFIRHYELKQQGNYMHLLHAKAITEDKQHLYQQYWNLVEEMSLASGLPMPQLYILPGDDINAITSGTSPLTYAIAVSSGALTRLSRDELQGVIAHEFGHILHGDVALFTRLTSWLFGLEGVHLYGEFLLVDVLGNLSQQRGRLQAILSWPVVGIFGLVVHLAGFSGWLGAKLLKMRISRECEYLADAEAVRFTRQADGIGGALKKIMRQQLEAHPTARMTEFSHMFFYFPPALFSSHPPIEQRLTALLQVLDEQTQEMALQLEIVERQRKPKTLIRAVVNEFSSSQQLDATEIKCVEKQLSISQAEIRQLAHRLPAMQNPHHLLAVLLLDADADIRRQQLAIVYSRLGKAAHQHCLELVELFDDVKHWQKLPIALKVLPRLRSLDEKTIADLTITLKEMILMDDEESVFEYVLGCLFMLNLQPRGILFGQKMKPERLESAFLQLLRIVAWQRYHLSDGEAAFHAACYSLGIQQPPPLVAPQHWREELEEALSVLACVNPKIKWQLTQALEVILCFKQKEPGPGIDLVHLICNYLQCTLPESILKLELALEQG